jgi:hypothetical protein
MRKTLVGLLMFFVFSVTVPLTVNAQTCHGRSYRRSSYSRNYARYNRSYSRSYARNTRYYNSYNSAPGYVYTTRNRPSFYRRHRNLINLGIATGAGALIGAFVGGRRGALIGTGIGAGSGALYTYGLNPKKRRYYRRY